MFPCFYSGTNDGRWRMRVLVFGAVVIGSVLGAIVLLARQTGRDVPTNAPIVRLIRAKEQVRRDGVG